jgi:hypothetical protein
MSKGNSPATIKMKAEKNQKAVAACNCGVTLEGWHMDKWRATYELRKKR